MRTLRNAVRWIFGSFYVLVGAWIVVATIAGLETPRQPNRAAQEFTDALTASRFIDPLLAISYLAGGSALLVDRTVPLGVVVLAPAVVVILFFHLLLSGQWIWGTMNFALFAFIAWQARHRLACLWSQPHALNRSGES